MEVGIKEHVFGPTNVKKTFPWSWVKKQVVGNG